MAKKSKDKFLNNNENLPITIEINWTPENIEEFRRCQRDVIYFAENYFYIVNLDAGRTKIKLYDPQKEAILKIIKNRRTVICASRQVGKALALDTPIPTPDGWTTMGQLKDGDKVFDENGEPCNVIKAHDVRNDRNCYEITFSNGEKIIADESHEWFTQTRNERKRNIVGSVKTTKQIEKTLHIGKQTIESNHRIPINKILQYDEKILPIDPYLFGYWLGDGESAGQRLCVGKNDINEICNIFEYISNKRILNVKERSYNISILKDENGLSFENKIKSLNVFKNKHIPKIYLQSSFDQRIELLKGLMDTDGYVNSRGICQYYTIKKELANNVKELINSLGIQCSITSKIPTICGKKCNRVYIITFKTNYEVFKLPRKLNRQKKNITSNKRNSFIYIKEIKQIESVPVRCISVDSPNNLFLCGRNMIPTHNSTLMTVVCLWSALFTPDFNIAILANKEDQAKEILERIKLAYQEIPNWLKSGVEDFTKEHVKFQNGSKIFVSTTSADAIRGKSVNLLFIDEFAHVRKEIADDFFKSIIPTLSSSKKSKLVIVSCVTDDTCVYTDQGIKQIKDFIPSDKEGLHDVDPYRIVGKNNSLNEGTLFFNNGEADIVEITSQSSSLKCSKTHKLFACKNGKYDWFQAGELNSDDYIAIKYGMNIWGNYDDLSQFSPVVNKKLKNIYDFKKITPDLAYFFGLYIAEGSVYKKIGKNNEFIGGQITITCGDDISNSLDRLGLQYSISKDKIHYYISSKELIELMEYVGFDLSLKAKQKKIPSKLLCMSKENTTALLQGIFDGDGSANNGCISFTSSSIELVKQIRIILINYGILTMYGEVLTHPTKKVRVSSMGYRLELNEYFSKVFYETIGFRFDRKQEKYSNVCHATTNNTKDIIPEYRPLIEADFRITKKKNIPSGLRSGFYIDKNISRHTLLKFKNYISNFSNELANEIISPDIKWEKIKHIIDKGKEKVYDFSLSNTAIYDPYDWQHSVIYNGIIGHQTPKGTENKYYKIFSDAEKGRSNWEHVKIYWHQIPGRDEAWKKEQLEAIGYDMEMWNQEYDIMFLEDGSSALNLQVIEKLKNMCKNPTYSFENGDYKIFREPERGKIYSIGVDVAEGVGQDYSVAHILDITDPLHIEHCATFATNKMQPYIFAEKLNQIARSWGRPYLCIERNKEGGQVVDALWEVHKYDNIIHYTMKNDKRGVYQNLGIFCHQNSKYTGITNMKYFIEHLESVNIYDLATVREFETFIRKENKTWAAKKGYHDDRVMAMVWALIILEKDIAERYLDVLEYDESGKPIRIKDPNADLADLSFMNKNNNRSGIDKSGASPSFSFIIRGQNIKNGSKLSINLEDDIESSGWNFVF